MEFPKFSIVIPTYNREKCVRRAIDSVLRQDFESFELIVVDDGSTDRSREVLQEYVKKDHRVRFFSHEKNRGVCPARNTGIDRARGEWVILLDSDDELFPNALSLISFCLDRLVSPDIARANFVYLWDDGTFSPYPLPVAGVWDYVAFLRFWNESLVRSDMLTCTRRQTFERIKFPEGFALESIYHLDFARHYKQQFFPIALAIEHTDAPNRITRLDFNRLVAYAPYRIDELRQVLERHGEALKTFAPKVYENVLRGMVSLLLLVGNRAEALHYLRLYRQFHRHPDFRFFLSFVIKTVFGSRFVYKFRYSLKKLKSRIR